MKLEKHLPELEQIHDQLWHSYTRLLKMGGMGEIARYISMALEGWETEEEPGVHQDGLTDIVDALAKDELLKRKEK